VGTRLPHVPLEVISTGRIGTTASTPWPDHLLLGREEEEEAERSEEASTPSAGGARSSSRGSAGRRAPSVVTLTDLPSQFRLLRMASVADGGARSNSCCPPYFALVLVIDPSTSAAPLDGAVKAALREAASDASRALRGGADVIPAIVASGAGMMNGGRRIDGKEEKRGESDGREEEEEGTIVILRDDSARVAELLGLHSRGGEGQSSAGTGAVAVLVRPDGHVASTRNLGRHPGQEDLGLESEKRLVEDLRKCVREGLRQCLGHDIPSIE